MRNKAGGGGGQQTVTDFEDVWSGGWQFTWEAKGSQWKTSSRAGV